MDYAIMDDKGIIEDFESESSAFNNVDRIRRENKDLKGDLKVIKILGTFN